MSLLNDSLGLLLKPFARFCVRRALKFQDLASAMKLALVEAAQVELRARGHAESISKLSAMTGLQRSDIDKILSSEGHQRIASAHARVVGQWYSDPRFHDKKGNPRKLTCEGKTSEFAELTASVSRELNPYALLFDLERTGTVRKIDGQVELLSSLYISADDIHSAMTYLGNDLNELIRAVEENVFDKHSTPNLHLKLYYDNLTVEDLPALKEWILREGSTFIQHVQRHVSKFDKDINPTLAKRRGGGQLSLGVFGRTEE